MERTLLRLRLEIMAGLASIVKDLTELHESQQEQKSDEGAQTPKTKSKPKFVLVFWIETKQFNVMSISKIRKDSREEGKITTVKAEGKEWTIKLVQISGVSSL